MTTLRERFAATMAPLLERYTSRLEAARSVHLPISC